MQLTLMKPLIDLARGLRVDGLLRRMEMYEAGCERVSRRRVRTVEPDATKPRACLLLVAPPEGFSPLAYVTTLDKLTANTPLYPQQPLQSRLDG